MQVTRATFIPLLAPAHGDRIDPGAVREEYFGDLNVVYTFGPQFGRRVVTHADLDQLAMPPQALRRSALEHLEVLASRAEFHGQPPALMLSFEGLESSLLLANDIWQRLEGAVPGELVVGVPARDVVVVTGSNSTAGLEKARRCIERVFFAGDQNLLSRTLLVRRGQAWEPFDRPAGVPRQTRVGSGPARHRGPDQPPRQYQDHPSWPGERVPVARSAARQLQPGSGAPVGMPPRPAVNPLPTHTGSMAPIGHTGMMPPVGPPGMMPPAAPLTHTGPMSPIHTGSMSPVHTGSMSPIHTGSMSPVVDVAPYSAIPYSAIPYSAIPNSASPYVPAPHAASEYLQSRGAQPKYRDDSYSPSDYPVSAVPQSQRHDDYRADDYRPAEFRGDAYRTDSPRDGAYREDAFREDAFRAEDRRAGGYRSDDQRGAGYPDAGYRSDDRRQDAYPDSPSGHGTEQPAYPGSWGSAPSAPSRPEFRSGPRARFAR